MAGWRCCRKRSARRFRQPDRNSNQIPGCHHAVGVANPVYRSQPPCRPNGNEPRKHRHHDAGVQPANQIRLNVQQITPAIHRDTDIVPWHQKGRNWASGKPGSSTQRFELSIASAFSASHALALATARPSPSSADGDRLPFSAFASSSRLESSDRWFDLRRTVFPAQLMVGQGYHGETCASVLRRFQIDSPRRNWSRVRVSLRPCVVTRPRSNT